MSITLFEAITVDPETLAANIVKNAHNSIKVWAGRRGIKAEFTREDFVSDFTRMLECLEREAVPAGGRNG